MAYLKSSGGGSYKTFTISWTEQANMSSGWTYSDDAAGMTAGSSDFDDFFGYSGVRLNTSGSETAEEKQNAGVLDITKLGTLTSGDNVMIKFPLRGIKMSKSGSIVTLSITDNPNADGYQYYAHSTGTLSNPGTPKDAFYVGTYKAFNSSNVLKSWSGQSPTTQQTQANFCTWAKANGSGYNILGFYQRQYINALYMMKYGNPNSQSVVGMGYVGGSSKTNTGGTNSQTNATYGTSSNSVQCKLFGIEDRWGNTQDRIGGYCTDASRVVYASLSGWSGTVTTSSPYESTGTTATGGNEISGIAGTNKGMFLPLSVVSNSSYNTYYCDSAYINASCLGIYGGTNTEGAAAGAFRTNMTDGATAAHAPIGARLMYL